MEDFQYKIIAGDSLLKLKELPDCSVDSIVTDPPYELGFMGKSWDKSGIANNVELWKECLRVLKPGGHMLAFSGSRTYHRMTCAIEDAGFEVRDQIMWLYGCGFPKSLDVSKAIYKSKGYDREVIKEVPSFGIGGNGTFNGVKDGSTYKITLPSTPEAKQWSGWGTALKPAHEPICVARKPLIGTVANNVLEHGTGGINIDGCRIGNEIRTYALTLTSGQHCTGGKKQTTGSSTVEGRWPANVIHDGSDEVLESFEKYGKSKSTSHYRLGKESLLTNKVVGKSMFFKESNTANITSKGFDDEGTPARYFYSAKATKKDRCGSNHPTVKPLSLMRYLVKLVTPPGGIVLDPFSGSGSTLEAALEEGFKPIAIDLTDDYIHDIIRRASRYELNKK